VLNNARSVRFGPFEADFTHGELRKFGIRLKVSGQPIEILRLLLDAPGEVVTREQIRERLWQANTFVDFDHSLNAAVNKLREALNDSAESPTYIETVPRRGYRFIGQISDTAQKPEPKIEAVPAAMPIPPAKRNHKWLVFGMVIVLLTVAGLLYSFASRRKLRLPSAQSRTTIAVLPFENLSGNPAQEYFSDGITEELSTQLARLNPGKLGVIARITATRYKHTDKTVRQIGEELGVEYVVEGSVRQDGERVRITTQLIRVSDQTHLWAENFDRDMRDLLALQSDVARNVAREIGVKVGSGYAGRGRVVDPEIITAYVMSKSLLSREGYEEARKYLEQLTISKPDDPEVWSALAFSYFNLAGRVMPQREAIARAKVAIEKALALDPNSPRVHSINAMIKFNYEADWKGSEIEHLKAIEADPSDARSHAFYALFLVANGRVEEAKDRWEYMKTLEPPRELFSCAQARLQYYAGESAEVVVNYRERFEADPKQHVSCYWYALAALQQNKFSGLRDGADRMVAASELQEYRSIAGYIYGRIGEQQKAREQLRFLEERRSRGQWVSAYNLALIHEGLGEQKRAMELLEEAAKEPQGMLVYLKIDPIWAPLRSQPRLAALMKKVGIPGA
jgi:TolB-like protein/DNA-binding winged helix-turn-helix (wHTH) protein